MILSQTSFIGAKSPVTMASVYKSLSKANGHKEEKEKDQVVDKNRQRVLILSSRGTTFRYEALQQH